MRCRWISRPALPLTRALCARPSPLGRGVAAERRKPTMQDIAQLLISGLATGAIYALIAMGFTLLWQTSGTINFAQGEFVMVPAFVMLAFMLLLGLPLWASFMLSVAVSALLLG